MKSPATALDNIHGYPEPVWQRFPAPRRAGVLQGPDVLVAEAGTPAARSVLRLTVRVRNGGVEAACFQAYGCPSAIAVGDWLTERLELDKPFVPPTAAQIRAALEITEDKAHCALMGEDVVRALWNQMT